jgi:hypothetical protein
VDALDGRLDPHDPMAVACGAALERALKRHLATAHLTVTDFRYQRLDNAFRHCVGNVLGVQLEPCDAPSIVLQPEKFSLADAQPAERAPAPATVVEQHSVPLRTRENEDLQVDDAFGVVDSSHVVGDDVGRVYDDAVSALNATAGAGDFQSIWAEAHGLKDTVHLHLLFMDTRRQLEGISAELEHFEAVSASILRQSCAQGLGAPVHRTWTCKKTRLLWMASRTVQHLWTRGVILCASL